MSEETNAKVSVIESISYTCIRQMSTLITQGSILKNQHAISREVLIHFRKLCVSPDGVDPKMPFYFVVSLAFGITNRWVPNSLHSESPDRPTIAGRIENI